MTKQEAFAFLAGELDGWLENEDDNLRSFGANYLPFAGWDLSDVDDDDLDHVSAEAEMFDALQASYNTLNDPTASEAAKVAAAGDACEALDMSIMQNLRDDAPSLSPDEAARYAQYLAACSALGFPV